MFFFEGGALQGIISSDEKEKYQNPLQMAMFL